VIVRTKAPHAEVVPFYMLPAEDFLANRACDYAHFSNKHAQGVQLLHSLVNHPWHRAIEKAKVCVVPVSIGQLSRGMCPGADADNWTASVYFEDILLKVGKVMKKHPSCITLWLADPPQANPRRWIRHLPPGLAAVAWHELSNGEFLGYRTRDFNPRGDCDTRRILIVAPYSLDVETRSIGLPRAETGLVMPDRSLPIGPKRKYFMAFGGKVMKAFHEDRKKIVFAENVPNDVFLRVSDVESKLKGRYALRHCEDHIDMDGNDADNVLDSGPCVGGLPARLFYRVMEQSKFTPCFRGDTMNADRMYNAFTWNTICVVIVDKTDSIFNHVAFPDIIPWQDIWVIISRKKFDADPWGTLNELRNMPDSEYMHRLHLLQKHRADLMYSVPDSRVVENYMLTAKKKMTAAVESCRSHLD